MSKALIQELSEFVISQGYYIFRGGLNMEILSTYNEFCRNYIARECFISVFNPSQLRPQYELCNIEFIFKSNGKLLFLVSHYVCGEETEKNKDETRELVSKIRNNFLDRIEIILFENKDPIDTVVEHYENQKSAETKKPI